VIKTLTKISIALSLTAASFGALAQEAPMLKEMVMAGSLPPLEERLPDNPLVVDPLNEVGEYGGTLSRGSALLFPVLGANMTREPLVSFSFPDPSAEAPVPNLAESWSFSEDGTQLTMNIRQGVRWSDGHEFSADDIAFFWEDVMEDPNTTVPVHPALFVAPGVAPEFEQIDKYTIRFTYPFAFKYALQSLSAVEDTFAWPKHELAQLHPKYNSDASYEEFNKLAPWWSDRSKETVSAWSLESVSDDSTLVRMVRNPYYWKVDTAGNQLPYVDYVEYGIVPDRQSVALGNISGQFDYDGTWVGNQHLPLFLREQEGRDLEIGWFNNTPGMAVYMNYDNADDNKRNLVRDLNFRKAMSLAIDRDSINRQFFLDLLEPSAFSFSPNSPYYEAEAGTQFAELDIERANALLDEAGYMDSDGDGIREYADGTNIQLVIDVANHDLYVPITELLVESIPSTIGIDLVMNNQQQDLIFERRQTLDWDLHIFDIYGSTAPLAKLEDWVPVSQGFPFWNQKASEAPFSPEYAEFSEILLGARALDYDTRVSEMKRANAIMTENVFNLYVGFYRRAFIYNSNLGNMPTEAMRDVSFGLLEGPMRPEQVYFKQ